MNITTPPPAQVTLLRFPQLLARLGLKRATVYLRLKSDKNFPRPVKLGERAVAFYAHEVDAYLLGLAATRKAE